MEQADDSDKSKKRSAPTEKKDALSLLKRPRKGVTYRGAAIPATFALEGETLLVARFGEQEPCTRMAAFDFDGTLCKHVFGRKLTGSVYAHAPKVLKALASHRDPYALAILTNESTDHLKNPGAIENAMRTKCDRLTTWLADAGITNILVLVALSKKDGWHKSKGAAMWHRALEELHVPHSKRCFFVGDSPDDRTLADDAGATYYDVKDFFEKAYPADD